MNVGKDQEYRKRSKKCRKARMR